MSWIQNFFQKFIKTDELEYDGYDIHTEKQREPLPQKINEGGKDLNTRISYQYPKGKDHYLAISNSSFQNTESQLRNRRSEQQPQPQQQKQQAQPKQPLRRSQELRQGLNEPINEKQEKPMQKLIEPPKRTRPFHPTEIPSPVYGFQRPAAQSTPVVEHELSQFLSYGVENPPLDTATPIESLIEPENKVKHESSPSSINEQDTDRIKEESREEETLEIEETSISMEWQQIQDEKVTAPIQDDNPSPIEEQVKESMAEKPKTARSPLPFNVMMLKQDKLKWEESKKRRRGEQAEKQQQVSPQKGLEKENPYQEIKQAEKKIETVPLERTQEPVHPTVNKGRSEEKATELPKREYVEVKALQDEAFYQFPQADLLKPPVIVDNDSEWLLHQESLLNQTLLNFNIGAKVVNVTQGPSVTRFEVQPEPGVKVNKITNLSDDIKLSLAARDIRIEAPIPGKHTIGIEVPNQTSRPVYINEIIQSSVFRDSVSPLTAVLGLDISGKPIVTDLKKMPHGLIAGATGSGKSVCINTILVSLLFKASPEDLKLLLIDPKMVELAPYNRIPHLVSPVITDVKAATAALKWAVDEMERRYELFAHTGVRDINRFNELAMEHKRYAEKLPFIVIIIDELADLMMMSPADVEEAICRIAQKARACGIHLIIATQRPSVDVITGLIKANVPTRIAFSVSSQIDSRTIIDISGAEKLLGRGDMLFLENGSSKPVRLQGTFVSDEEIDLVVEYVREQREPDYLFEQEELLKKAQITEEEDELFYEACEFIIEQGLASTSSLQRRFKIGYNRAARLMDMLETNGFITSANGSKPREVLITEGDLEAMQDTGTIK